MSITRRITLTAILLALTLVFQSLRLFIPMPPLVALFLVGTLVNLCLLLAVYFVGFWHTLIIAVLAPVAAFFQGHLPNPLLIPVVAFGNAVLPLAWSYLHTYREWVSKSICVIIGSVLKFGVLFYLMRLVFKLFIASTLAQSKEQDMINLINLNYSWPQLVTALAGGFLAIVIGRSLEKVVFEKV